MMHTKFNKHPVVLHGMNPPSRHERAGSISNLASGKVCIAASMEYMTTNPKALPLLDLEDIICRHGTPAKCITDDGRTA